RYPVEGYDIKPGDQINMDAIWYQMRTVYDPEIPVNIVDLGLIYNIITRKLENGNFHEIIDMTLTSPGCGMGQVLMTDVEKRVAMLPN
ncbi:iron-sulfur cluster assembly protein, partial [Francisella tularensis subsp. holarctica]|uniref:iron-sulfur cluster assembly protein n=1 Tax=Francisella tularensis TaxID=263 RepID=UPI002381C233